MKKYFEVSETLNRIKVCGACGTMFSFRGQGLQLGGELANPIQKISRRITIKEIMVSSFIDTSLTPRQDVVEPGRVS